VLSDRDKRRIEASDVEIIKSGVLNRLSGAGSFGKKLVCMRAT
jgi:hypothetical protein